MLQQKKERNERPVGRTFINQKKKINLDDPAGVRVTALTTLNTDYIISQIVVFQYPHLFTHYFKNTISHLDLGSFQCWPRHRFQLGRHTQGIFETVAIQIFISSFEQRRRSNFIQSSLLVNLLFKKQECLMGKSQDRP